MRATTRTSTIAAALLALGAWQPVAAAGRSVHTAQSAQSAKIEASLTPEKLGGPTTVGLGFRIAANGGQIPSPLVGLDFRYPVDLGIATSELGTAECPIAPLEASGPAICPANSHMGTGAAEVEIPVGGGVETERASIALVAGPSENGYVNMVVTADGLSPVIARILMSSLLLPGELRFAVPLVESLPGAPYVSVVHVSVTLGGRFTYYERQGNRTIAYHPRSVALPRRCPRGGFRFSASFSFLDGSSAAARTVVACPRGRA